MTREQMIKHLITLYGFENPNVIWFCELCAKYEENDWNNACLFDIYRSLFELVQYESELQ